MNFDVDNHEWIENYLDFEAVLCCTNTLSTWDRDACLRAFQTFGFDDVSSVGDYLAFVHQDSGVMIRYEGGLCALEFGDEGAALHSVFADLFAALHSLGWAVADVLHPSKTMGNLLADMGKAIPAHMEFDVKAARIGQEISSFVETNALAEHTQKAMQRAGIVDGDNGMLDALASMEPTMPTTSSPFSFLQLDDDQPQVSPAPPRYTVPAAANYSEAPSVVVSSGTPATYTPPLSPPVAIDLALLQATPLPVIQTVLPADTLHNVDPSVKPVYDSYTPERGTQSTLEAPPVAVLRTGASVFYFSEYSRDGATSAANALGETVAAHPQHQVVHLHLGAMDSLWRWDVLGELTPGNFWFLEKLCSWLQLPSAWRLGGAKALLGLPDEFAQLRDLIPLLNAANPDHDCPLSWLEICPPGRAFIDVREASTISAVADCKTFSVRGLIESSQAYLFIVHQDALDGPFTQYLSDLLLSVVGAYSASRQSTPPVAAIENPAAKKEFAADLRALLARAEGLGIQV
jgi:hypothetical protein